VARGDQVLLREAAGLADRENNIRITAQILISHRLDQQAIHRRSNSLAGTGRKIVT